MINETYSDKSVVDRYALSRHVPDSVRTSYAKGIIEAIGEKELGGKIAIDLGCGKGVTLFPLASIGKSMGLKVIGNDISKAMIEFCRQNILELGLDNVELNDLDLVNSDSNLEGRVSLLHIKAVTHLQRDPYKFLDGADKLLSPNGYIVLGCELSQPEDNLENISKYGKNGEREDSVLKDFYAKYFELRKQFYAFQTPKMPAGNNDHAAEYLKSKGYKVIGFSKNSVDLKWDKRISFKEILDAMKFGTFNVFRIGITEEQRKILCDQMLMHTSLLSIDINEDRIYPAQLSYTILKKI